MGRAELDFVRARLASWGGDPRGAPELLLRAAKQFEPLDVGLAQAVYLQAMAAACVAGNFARGAGIGDIARAAKSCPVSAAPTTGEWLVAGLARVTADGPAAAAPSLRRALQATPSDMIDGEGIHWLGYQCGAASVLWDHDSLHRLAALHVTATRGAGALDDVAVGVELPGPRAHVRRRPRARGGPGRRGEPDRRGDGQQPRFRG